jgi:hypothetical protein
MKYLNYNERKRKKDKLEDIIKNKNWKNKKNNLKFFTKCKFSVKRFRFGAK